MAERVQRARDGQERQSASRKRTCTKASLCGRVLLRHVEQVAQGLYALRPSCSLSVDCVNTEVERLRHLLWNGRHDEAHAVLGAVAAIAGPPSAR